MTTTSPRGEPVLRPALSRPALSVRARTLFLVLVVLLAALPAAGLAVATGGGAGGHRSEVTVTGNGTGIGDVPVPGRPADRSLPGPGGDGGTLLSCRAAEPPHGGPSR
ncbi:hypothetical protein [Streptomyces viridosporus]|uniref:hypothetical protein n=1 Tax=Streptomyces viridosporus TaxID=67581 RepID=UPI0033238712